MDAKANARPVYPPVEVADGMLALDVHPGVPIVEAVSDVPLVARDGTLSGDPGLGADGFWYRPAKGMGDVPVESCGHVDDVLSARELLLDYYLGDFDFKGQPDRANALGLMLTLFVRRLVDAPTPMHTVVAPQPGSGKWYLLQALLIPAAGMAAMRTFPSTDEELRKAITTQLLRGRPVIAFDNFPQGRTLDTSVLAGALTMSAWEDRLLGGNKEVSVPVRCAWAITANNLQESGELRDRTVPIELDPRGGRHRAREGRGRERWRLRHRDLHGWAMANRGLLAGACLTLVRHWALGAFDTAPSGELHRPKALAASRPRGPWARTAAGRRSSGASWPPQGWRDSW